MRPVLHIGLMLVLQHATCVDGRRRGVPSVEATGIDDEGMPTHWSKKKKAEIQAASDAEAHERRRRQAAGLPLLPLFPTHATECNGRACRPGEGNLRHSTERGVNGQFRYKQWTQPYEHREAYVQSRSRRPPHRPDAAHYAELTRIAKGVAVNRLVLVTAADWDYRALAWNWLAHVRQFGHTNAVILSMDRELHRALTSAGATSFDNSANLDAWNRTCLQRHIQAVRTERHLAMAALVASGLDVLLTCAPAIPPRLDVRPIRPCRPRFDAR
jgi:hypothetical protein